MVRMTYHEIISIVESLAVTSAAIVAIIGINAWRREAKWKRKAEVAEEVLLAFHKVQAAFEVIRSPAVWQDELPPDSTGSLQEKAAVTSRRFHANADAFTHLRTLRWKYHIMFPKASEEPFKEVELLLGKILSSSHMLGAVVWPRQGTNLPEEEFQKHLNEMHELESWHWRFNDERDPFKPRFANALRQVEAECSRYVA